jgi:hypothetical protein
MQPAPYGRFRCEQQTSEAVYGVIPCSRPRQTGISPRLATTAALRAAWGLVSQTSLELPMTGRRFRIGEEAEEDEEGEGGVETWDDSKHLVT